MALRFRVSSRRAPRRRTRSPALIRLSVWAERKGVMSSDARKMKMFLSACVSVCMYVCNIYVYYVCMCILYLHDCVVSAGIYVKDTIYGVHLPLCSVQGPDGRPPPILFADRN